MGSLNKVMLIGNLGRDPEVRISDSGLCICQLSLATNSWQADGGKGESHPEWHTIVAFGRLAEIGRDYLKKGKKVYVEGRLRTRTYQKEDGPKQWFTEVIASDIQFLDSSSGLRDGSKGTTDVEF